MEGAGKSTK
jgi:aquaporin Z